MKNKIYVSCPMSIGQDKLDSVLVDLRKIGFVARAWKRNTPYIEDEYIPDCDYFVVILPDLKWTYEIDDLPSGTRKELKLAINLKKPIFIAYQTQNHGINIYKATIGEYDIEGIASTSHTLTAMFKEAQREASAPHVQRVTEKIKEMQLNPGIYEGVISEGIFDKLLVPAKVRDYKFYEKHGIQFYDAAAIAVHRPYTYKVITTTSQEEELLLFFF